jgi:hypothetical protein
MALVKEDLVNLVSEADKLMFNTLEKRIDGELQMKYSPGGSVSVPLKGSKYNQRVLDKVKRIYQDSAHGWKVELVSDQRESQDYLVFS